MIKSRVVTPAYSSEGSTSRVFRSTNIIASRNSHRESAGDSINNPYFLGSPLARTAQVGTHVQPKTEKTLMNRSRSTAALPVQEKKPPNKV